MNNREQRTDVDDVVPSQDLDEPREHRGYDGRTLISDVHEQAGGDAEPGPNDDDGLPENARRRVPS